jgi:ankyrin repeat protein
MINSIVKSSIRYILIYAVLIILLYIAIYSIMNYHINESGDNLLNMAIERHSYKSVRFLLFLGVDINTKNRAGRSPIAIASSEMDIPMLEILIEHGADINSKTKDGVSLVALAIPDSRLKLIHQPDKSLKTVKFLIEHGAKFDEKDCDGDTPLCAAIMGDYPKTVDYLINLGIDISCDSKYSNSYLKEAAIYTDDVDIIKILLTHGASLNCKDYKGSDKVKMEMPYNHYSAEEIALIYHHFAIANYLKTCNM